MDFKDYKNEDAIDMLADLIEPATAIFQDKELAFIAKQNNVFKLARLAMKKHPTEIIEILARIDGVEKEKYSISAPRIIAKLINLIQDKDMMYFFGIAEQSVNEGSSGSATESTEEREE